jgi:hypothetical protein
MTLKAYWRFKSKVLDWVSPVEGSLTSGKTFWDISYEILAPSQDRNLSCYFSADMKGSSTEI